MAQTLVANFGELYAQFSDTREKTLEIFKPLRIEDAVMQSDDFGSPPNWHLAHVTWFFQKVLEKHGATLDSKQFNLQYINSYYQRFGEILPKPQRGRHPRPTVEETLRYRAFMEKEVLSFLKDAESSNRISEELTYDILLGIHHELQHQELIVYDLQNYFQRFPDPDDNYKPLQTGTPRNRSEKPSGMAEIPSGIYELGFHGDGFCYDNELPEHKVYLHPFKIDVGPVTNAEYIKFVEAGGYEDYGYWLSDGWDMVNEQGWRAPLYWVREEDEGRWTKKDLRGYREIDPDEPVTNVSYYEADAYAKWAGKRLPTEAEWEKAASWNDELGRKTRYPWGDENPTPERANLLESHLWSPCRIGSYPEGRSWYGCHQMLGDVWEWTSSEYGPYPGFRSRFSEYTDKWMINQKVLKGGSFATPFNQIRNSYRNYFKPHERILFAGFRCAKDI